MVEVHLPPLARYPIVPGRRVAAIASVSPVAVIRLDLIVVVRDVGIRMIALLALVKKKRAKTKDQHSLEGVELLKRPSQDIKRSNLRRLHLLRLDKHKLSHDAARRASLPNFEEGGDENEETLSILGHIFF